MSFTRSYSISDQLFLVSCGIQKTAEAPKPVETPTHHIVVTDCSGSMYGDLGKVREQLKKKLPKMVSEKDLVTLVWFSGRGQCGILLEAEPVATLTDLNNVNKAIDRWLQPQGLTGFKDPLIEVAKVVASVKKSHPGHANSLLFMSDGCDNQWSRAEILKAVEEAAGSLNAATFVEYGYYADRNLLSAMAEKAGGTLIFSDGFNNYAPVLEATLAKKVLSAPKVEVKIEGDVVGGFAFAMDGEDLLTFAVEDGKVWVPETLTELWYVSSNQVGEVGESLPAVAKRAAATSLHT